MDLYGLVNSLSTPKRGHWFVDMHSCKTNKGVRRKRNYAVHNRPLYGQANEIVKELTVGLTDAVAGQLLNTSTT